MRDNPVKLFSSPIEFETFGTNAIAYVRRVQSSDMNTWFPDAPRLPEGIDLWGLFAADGEPLAVADEQGSLFESAEERDLLAVQRH